MRESVNVTVLMSNDWLCFVFMHFTCLLLLAAGEVVGQCMCTDLFAFIYFLFFLLNCFFYTLIEYIVICVSAVL